MSYCQSCAPKYPHTSLEEWRQEFCCISPWEMFQIAGQSCRITGACKRVFREHGWFEGAHIGRSQIRKAILEAEQTLAERLQSPVVPTWITEFQPATVCAFDSFRLKNKNVHEIGEPALVGVGEYPVDIQIEHGQCAGEFTLVLPFEDLPHPFVLDELGVFIADADRTIDKSEDRLYKISPINVSNVNGEVHITGPTWLLVRPAIYQQSEKLTAPISDFGDYSISPTHRPNYVEKLAVKWSTSSPEYGAMALFEPSNCDCGRSKCNTGCHIKRPVQICIEDAARGEVKPQPHEMCGRLLGYCITYLAYDCTRNWATTIARLSACSLCGVICDCNISCLAEWQKDLAVEAAREGGRTISFVNELDNELGTCTGQIYAARQIAMVQQSRRRDFSAVVI